jgi:transposase InsO family protein
MEEQWYVGRARLRELLDEHPDWTQGKLADACGRSLGWAKKWCKRLRQADPDDETVLHGLSRARKHPPPSIAPEVVEHILEIRDSPPGNLQRTPGPCTILYYLHQDEQLKANGAYLPRSTSTIWKILDRHGRIWRPPPVEHQPLERPDPMSAWQVDFKDVVTVPPDPEGKQQHVVEVFNVVDAGTSILVDAQPRTDYNAETAIQAMAQTLLLNGLPDTITFDRDPRFVGSWSGRDFPSAFVRFLMCLGIEADVCPPQRPDLNPFVERYHRTYEYECLRVHRPTDVQQVQTVTEAFGWHYNHERPNQAITCANRPPYQAFPSLPERPRLPEMVDPDRWLRGVHNRRFKRRVTGNGTVKVDKHRYYVQRALKGRYVVLRVDAQARQLVVELDGKPFKEMPIKGLHDEVLGFQTYLDLICREAYSERRRRLHHTARRRYTM